MARPRRRSGRKSQSGKVAVLISLLCLLVVLGGGISWFVMKARTEYVPRDIATLCPLSGYTSQTLVLIDTTDPIASVTRTEVLERLKDLVTGIPENGLLELRVLSEDPENITPVLALCNPGDGSDLDPLTSSPEIARQRWETEYSAKVLAVLDQAMAGQEQNASPIMEAIQRIAAEHLTAARDRSIPSRLVVVSDMIQHTDRYSHYREGLSFERYEQVEQRLATDLAQSRFEFWLIRRDVPSLPIEDLITFWLTWAGENNAQRPPVAEQMKGML